VQASVRDWVWDSVWASARAYSSSFIKIKYERNYSPLITLWNRGIVPSFDGKTWRLHSGPNADVIFKISKEELINVKEK
jgi:hypothetical protein